MKALFFNQIDRFYLFPVIHHSYEFTLATRAAFKQIQPKAIAVEYPNLFADLILKAIDRLPRISILVSGDRTKQYIRIEPVDPFVEALRLARENKLPARCIDATLSDYPEVYEPLPDTYAITALGHQQYCEMILKRLPSMRVPEDDTRELAMAFHLQQFSELLNDPGPILVLCGVSHLRGLAEQLKKNQPRPFEQRLPGKLFHLSSSSLGEIMAHFPFFTEVYEKQRSGRSAGASPAPQHSPRTAALQTGLRMIRGEKAEDLSEFVRRAQEDVASGKSDRHEIFTRYLFWCRSYYEQEIGDKISPQQMFLLDNFVRKYANVKAMLLPDFYELLVAGRSCISSHFCYRMWQIGTAYPLQEGASELEIIELRASDIFPLVNKVRMNPHAPLRPRAALPRFLRRSEKQRKMKKEDWRFNPFSICSYQPEDITVENYGAYLRSKGKNILSEERKRVRPFETSLLDGIDLRETIRNWHSGNIFVQECMMVKGAADSVVVIFDEDHHKYPYSMTWLGEHNQESDMAFYATDPEERTIGPGIRKALYGGFLMTMPPGRLFDVFADPAYAWTTSYSEKLLMAGIDYGLEKYVVYAASKPPRPFFQTVAGRYGKRILYIPLAQLSPVMLQRIRTFHILSDKSVRDYAKDYIW